MIALYCFYAVVGIYALGYLVYMAVAFHESESDGVIPPFIELAFAAIMGFGWPWMLWNYLRGSK